MSGLRRLSLPVGLLTLLLALAAVFQPIPFGLAVRVWLVAVGALGATALLRAALAPYPAAAVEPIRPWRRRASIQVRPPGLEEVERAVDFAAWNPADLRSRLRPLLREVATVRLRAAGVDLDRHPEVARARLGEEAWALLSDEVEVPDASAPALRRAVESLEAL